MRLGEQLEKLWREYVPPPEVAITEDDEERTMIARGGWPCLIVAWEGGRLPVKAIHFREGVNGPRFTCWHYANGRYRSDGQDTYEDLVAFEG